MSDHTSKDISAAYSVVKRKYSLNFDLKDKQTEALLHLVNRRHVLTVLPTGYGKSEIFALLPLILNEIDQTKKHFSLVVIPLVSLMQDMVDRFTASNIPTTAVQSANVSDLKDGRFSVLLITPEYLKDAMRFRGILELDIYQLGLSCFAVDEAHVLVHW